jgi:hypothetical protein
MAYGTLTTLDTLAASQATIAEIGEDSAWAGIEAGLAAHNAIVRDMMTDLLEVTTDRQRRYGGGGEMVMDEVDQFGRADAQKPSAGVTVGFPLRAYQVPIQWTRKFFQVTTGAQLAALVNDAMTADLKTIQRQVKRAIFTPTNTTFTDRLVDNVSLAVKAFVNADSAEIPVGPNGETFTASSHTHYLANASLTATAVNGLVEAVAEHFNSGDGLLYIARGNETTLRGLTGFTPYYDMRINPGANAAAANGNLDPMNLNNRAIGIWNGGTGSFEVWVKPWVPTGYLFATVRGVPKPLVFRERAPGSGDLTLVADEETHPLRARLWEREYGISVWTRTNGAVLYAAGGSYTTPSFT